MKRILLFATALAIGANGMAQTADFQTSLSQSDTSWFGQTTTNQSGDTLFTTGFYSFENNYNPSWESTTGWSYSNVTDNSTAGYLNQFGNITGTGENSDQFGICYVSDFGKNRLFSTNGSPFTPNGSYFTNTTYAYLSMQDGDSFGTQFGDVSNSSGGEDWFLLTVYGLNADSTYNGDSVNFYLADYRFADNANDYLIDAWTWVDLSSLENVYGLDFKLSSSDVGGFGMNTPSYFAMDNFDGNVAGVEVNLLKELSVYPNPTSGSLNILVDNNSVISLFDINGRLIKTEISNSNLFNWNISNIENGVYILKVENNGKTLTQRIIKK
jgi:hypothetical protein